MSKHKITIFFLPVLSEIAFYTLILPYRRQASTGTHIRLSPSSSSSQNHPLPWAPYFSPDLQQKTSTVPDQAETKNHRDSPSTQNLRGNMGHQNPKETLHWTKRHAGHQNHRLLGTEDQRGNKNLMGKNSKTFLLKR